MLAGYDLPARTPVQDKYAHAPGAPFFSDWLPDVQVILTASPQAPGSWTWTADDVDYGAAGPTGPPQASPGWEQNYVLCVYDGSAAITNDFITPVSPQMGTYCCLGAVWGTCSCMESSRRGTCPCQYTITSIMLTPLSGKA
jgi:hypothetical protein